MFAFRDQVSATSTTSRVDVAFTDSSLDLHLSSPHVEGAFAQLSNQIGLPLSQVNQVHGDAVQVLTQLPETEFGTTAQLPRADAQVTRLRGVALLVRVADCVPIVLADPAAGVVGVVHAGRAGVALGVVNRAVEAMRELGASEFTAWLGPHVCGACYEVPAELRDEVSALVPQTRSTTRSGTPSLDLGAGVMAQLGQEGARVIDVGRCTLEDAGLHSYRRDGQDSGRFAGLVWLS